MRIPQVFVRLFFSAQKDDLEAKSAGEKKDTHDGGSPGSLAGRPKAPNKAGNTRRSKPVKVPDPVKPFTVEDLPGDIIEKIYTGLGEPELRALSLTQKNPPSDGRQALSSAWLQVAKHHGAQHVSLHDLAPHLMMKAVDSWRAHQQQEVTETIERLEPNWLEFRPESNMSQSLNEIAAVVARAPRAITRIDLSMFALADAEQVAKVFSGCTNLEHLALPLTLYKEDLDVFSASLQKCAALKSLVIESHFEVDRDALRAQLPQSLKKLKITRVVVSSS